MTDTRVQVMPETLGALSWPVWLENDYFNVCRLVLVFSTPVVNDEELSIQIISGSGPARNSLRQLVPVIGASNVIIEDISNLVTGDQLLIELPNAAPNAVTINGYAVLERAKPTESGTVSTGRIYVDGLRSARVQVSNIRIEPNGGVAVNIQDQTSPLLDLHFAQGISAPTTLSVDVVLPTRQVTVTSIAGFTVGELVGIFSGVSLEGRYYFGTILSISANTLTLDTFLSFPFEAGDPIARLTRDMNVDGSSTEKIFAIQGAGTGSPLVIDVTNVCLTMECASAVDLSKFGDLPALTRGLVLRRADGLYTNYWNIKRNAGFELRGEWTPHSAINPAQGVDGLKFIYRVAGQGNHGVAIRLAANESLELIIQDDLRGLTRFRGLVQGHEVIT